MNVIAEEKVVIKRIIIDTLVMFTACCFSLSTLVYVAEGDADRIYRDFYRAAAYSQGQLIQTETELFLQMDFPLQQFAGFSALADPTIAETSSIGSVELLDARGEIVFRDLAAAADLHANPGEPAVAKTASEGAITDLDGEEVKLPLLRKSEIVGSIVLDLRLDRIAARVSESFRPIWVLVLICSAAFAGLTVATRKIAWELKRVWTALAFTATFVMVAGLITAILVSLYTEGAGVKGKALLKSLSGRLQEVTAYNISFDQLEGTDKLLADYRQLNPDILSIGLSIGGVAKFDTDPQRPSRRRSRGRRSRRRRCRQVRRGLESFRPRRRCRAGRGNDVDRGAERVDGCASSAPALSSRVSGRCGCAGRAGMRRGSPLRRTAAAVA